MLVKELLRQHLKAAWSWKIIQVLTSTGENSNTSLSFLKTGRECARTAHVQLCGKTHTESWLSSTMVSGLWMKLVWFLLSCLKFNRFGQLPKPLHDSKQDLSTDQLSRLTFCVIIPCGWVCKKSRQYQTHSHGPASFQSNRHQYFKYHFKVLQGLVNL